MKAPQKPTPESPLGGTPEQNRAFLETLSSIRAECIAKIVVSPELLPDIVKALQIGYEEYLLTKDGFDLLT